MSKDKEKQVIANTVYGEVTVEVVKIHPRMMFLWEQIGKTEFPDGTKVILGIRSDNGSLFLTVGEGPSGERFMVGTYPLAQAMMRLIDETRKEKP